MKLYDFEPAPNPRRVRICIAEKGLQIPVEQVDLGSGEQFGDAFRAINPACTVPVLETDEGVRLTECVAIYAYLEGICPEPPLMGDNPADVARTLNWNHIVENEGFHAIAESFRNFSKAFVDRPVTGPERYPQQSVLVERGRARAEAFFDRMETRLASRTWLATDAFSIADISLYVGVDFAGWIKLEATRERPALADWYARVASRPSARA